MASLYTYPENTGRQRFSPAKWTGQHGERVVDLAWTRANEPQLLDGADYSWWAAHEQEFPESMRDELRGLYTEALKRMRAYLEARQ